MKTRTNWTRGRIDFGTMGRKWTIVNWSFLICGLILVVLNLVGSRVFDIPLMYIIYAGFAYMLALVVYLITVLIAFVGNKNIIALDNGMIIADDYQLNPYGNAIIDETKHETTFIKPQVRWQYGALYIGLAIWLSIRTVDLFKVLFIENHDPMPLSVSAMPVLALVLGTGVTIVLAVLGVQQLLGTKE